MRTESLIYSTRKMVIIGVLIALHVVLAQVATIPVANSFSITLSGITEVIAGFLFGPVSGGVAGLIGSLLNQILKYGISATTFLWILPAGLKGLLCGWYAKSRGYHLNPLQIYWVLVITAFIVTAINTNIMIVDATVYGYNTNATVLAAMGIRYANGVLTSAIYMAITAPLLSRVSRMEGIGEMRE